VKPPFLAIDPLLPAPAPLLALRGISKAYPGVQALKDVDFDLYAGEVHALVGENGAGKSTLMKIMGGAIRRDAGEVCSDGKPLLVSTPAEALAAGIRTIHQEFSLVPELSVADNMFLGREPVDLQLIQSGRMREGARRILDELGAPFDASARVGSLSVGERQLVEIGKALAANARVIAMDEPTAALTDRETERLFGVVARLKARGVGIIYISHRLEELQRIADRVTVMRDGQRVETRPMAGTTIAELIRLMVGRPLEDEFPARPFRGSGRVALHALGLRRRGVLHDVDLEIREGEILGIAGLMGSGRTELLRALFGADPIDGGRILLDGRPIVLGSPADAIRRGIALVPEDRKEQGLVLQMMIRENVTLAGLPAVSPLGWVRRKAERAVAVGYVREMRIRTPSTERSTSDLSGGNQQKVVLAKWLFTGARVLLFDEPTRGIDVGAKAEIYELLVRLAAEGKAVVMVSSEMPEILGLSDRIAVLHEGRIAGVLSRDEASQEAILRLATGQG
jgi:ribose transport system ATP-binding protein